MLGDTAALTQRLRLEATVGIPIATRACPTAASPRMGGTEVPQGKRPHLLWQLGTGRREATVGYDRRDL